MGTAVRQIIITGVTVMEKTVSHVANCLMGSFYGVALARKLDMQYLQENLETIERGLRRWLQEGSLRQACLEVYLPDQHFALERWDFVIGHHEGGAAKPVAPDMKQLRAFCEKLPNFPSGASYRVVVQTADGATPVPGWTPTELLDLRGTSAAAVQEWCYGGTAVGLAFRKGA